MKHINLQSLSVIVALSNSVHILCFMYEMQDRGLVLVYLYSPSESMLHQHLTERS